jgi:hypothetical protein
MHALFALIKPHQVIFGTYFIWSNHDFDHTRLDHLRGLPDREQLKGPNPPSSEFDAHGICGRHRFIESLFKTRTASKRNTHSSFSANHRLSKQPNLCVGSR